MAYETVIGLEVHVELSTKTKIFCNCSTEFGGEPNSHTCPVCLGMPGTLPVLNEAVAEKAIAAGLATNCEIQADNLFDRKNYFYPDLPKDYQISQLYHPICRDGFVEIDIKGEDGKPARKSVRIHEIHMEEDAGKLVHDAGVSLIDYNRCGVPLIEIVTEPDMSNADEVEAFIEALREKLVYLGVSDCKMQEGSMRADVNVSVREKGSTEFGTRTETKNMNSIKAIKRSIEFEVRRQIELIERGEVVRQETRRWDDAAGEGSSMRSKENAQDYRYFPDPDLVPIHVDEAWVSRVRDGFPELADAKRERYVRELGLDAKMAAVLTKEKAVAELFEEICSELEAAGLPKASAEAANIVVGEILRLQKETGADEAGINIDAKKVSAVLKLVAERKINRANGKAVIEAIYKDDVDVTAFIEQHDLLSKEDAGELAGTVALVLTDNPKSIADYVSGKKQAIGYLVGQTMKALGGKADPQAVNAELQAQLEAIGVNVPDVRGAAKSPEDGGAMAASKEAASCDDAAKSADRQDQAAAEIPTWKRKALAADAGEISSVSVKASGRYRDMTCGDISAEHVGRPVRLAGWVMSIRNHGGIVFVDLRDQYGVTQVVVTDEQVAALNKETAISVLGEVLMRSDDTVNPNIATGRVELRAKSIEIVGPCRSSLPFEIDQSTDTREDLRLKYRYLDLRNPKLKDNLFLRNEVIKHLRREMDAMGFLEVQTPILANSSPEGARDYLVPSRKHKGKFYALPQAPQQFKQLLMASGFDRYYQIAPCFRDEDARLDRSPGEFYQLDFELAFATQEDVFAVAERVLTTTFERFSDKEVSKPPYRRITFAESMLKYGSDKPDLRNPLEIMDLSEFFLNVDMPLFKGKSVRGLVVPGAAAQSKSWFGSMEKFAVSIGMKGLGYITVREDGTYKGPIDKFFTDEQRQEIMALAGLNPGDVLYFVSDEKSKVSRFAGEIRTEVAKRLELIDASKFELCFITDYPMYEMNEDEGKIDFTHNPFSMPQGEMDALQNKDPLEIMAYQYDIVCNGVELSSGAVRNHRPDIMVKAFEIAGYSEKDVEEKFGALYNAFSYGAPPHAGMAPGVDRIVMLLAEEENIREIIAFPLNSNAQNLMLDAPSEVTEQQLRDVHIKIR